MRNLLRNVLAEHFSPEFCANGRELIAAVLSKRIDIVLLDIRLPGEDGLAIARGLRARSSVPIVMLSGLATAEMVSTGLDIGADDYVTKPFSAQVLCARLNSVLRRQRKAARRRVPEKSFRFLECKVDLWRRCITRPDGQSVDLSETQLQILFQLAAQPGKVVTREEICRFLGKRAWSPEDRSIDVHISLLRKKLKFFLDRENTIVALRGKGYAIRPGDAPR